MYQKMRMLALMSGTFLMLQACNKSDSTVDTSTAQTVTATVSKNGAYTYTLPATTGNSRYTITTAASHAKTSVITTDAAGTAVYQYAPATDYTGADAVVLTSTSTSSQGKCESSGTATNVVTVQISVIGTSGTSAE